MNSRSRIAILLIAVSIFSIGCMGPTLYRPATESMTGGYSDSKLQEDMYNVSFAGNAFITHEEAKNYLLYRCAEVTIRDGYDYFIVVSGDSVTNFSRVGYGTVAKPNYTSTIKLGKGTRPDNAYDARQIMKNLETKIKRPD